MSIHDPNHVHEATCREIIADGTSLTIKTVCGQPDPYIAGQWTGGIKVVRHEKGIESPTPAGSTLLPWGAVSFKTQCYDCRQHFGRWWKVEGEGLLPTEEEVRARGKEILEHAGFRQDGDGWHCADLAAAQTPGEAVRQAYATGGLLIVEGEAMSARVWPE